MICSIETCGNPSKAHGLCDMHYMRLRRKGTTDDGHLRDRGSLAERLWARVDRTGDCWLWTGATNRKGYGRISRGGRAGGAMLAHRAAWEVTNGPIPDGLYVCHRCDNPPCVNPAHLFLGDDGVNVSDMTAKGRQWKQSVTHCPKGHEYTPENTKPNVGGKGRRCRTCHNEDMRRRRASR